MGGDQRVGVPGGGTELLLHAVLADQVVPYGHGSPPFRWCAGRTTVPWNGDAGFLWLPPRLSP